MAAPSPSTVWVARYRQALKGREFSERRRALMREVLLVEHQLGSDVDLIDGHWQPNPRQGDRVHAAAERQRIWAEVGDWLGIGPPPEEYFGDDR
jgi:hypothetical protein